MPLFDDQVVSIGIRPKAYAEPTFDYYNRSGRTDIRRIKQVLEEWFDHYPNDGRDDLRARFRSSIESQHRAALFELLLYQALRSLGYDVELHPEIGRPTHPDFLARHRNGLQFYVEATTTGDSEEEVAAQRRIDQVYDTLNRLDSPDFFIAVIDRGNPVTPPPGARLRRDLERWLRTLRWEDVNAAWDQGGFDGVPVFPWQHDGWNVAFKPIPKSGTSRGSRDVRPIGLTMPTEIHQLSVDEEIKQTVLGKDRYGQLGLPLIIAINVLGDFCDTYDVMNALFGHETVIFDPRGTRPGGRLHDGAWDGPNGPRHTGVSAVLVFRDIESWNIHNREPWLVHNPWATETLDPAAFPFSQYVPNQLEGKMDQRPGSPFGESLRLPVPWPPEED